MRIKDNKTYYSPSDLSGHIHCPRLTALNKLAMLGELKKPMQKSRVVETLQKRGIEFEQAFLAELRAKGKRIVEIDQESSRAYEETIEAMKSGADYIYQARMEMDNWQGWADFLIRVEKPSKLGSWSYEVCDTKLATQTKAGTILQIALYSEIVSTIQGILPDMMHIRQPKGHEQHRFMDYAAYYRLIKKKFLSAVKTKNVPHPDPVSHCDICNWWKECDTERRKVDHLSYVAGLGNTQLQELRENQNINKLEELAKQPLPLPFKPKRGSILTYEKLREQARLQLEVRNANGEPKYELLPRENGFGFFRLPEPNADDIFLDLEGDPLVPSSGREYIIGYCHKNKYHISWAETEKAEKKAFEKFIDFAMKCYRRSPDMRIYHYAPYETSAFKRLMLKYSTRIEETEMLLRSGTFVDLYQIVKQSLRAGVEKYSLKDLEKYHKYTRKESLQTVGPVKADYEFLLETGRVAEATPEMRQVIEKYNADDCWSTVALFKWLSELRAEMRANGEDIPAPEKKDSTPHENETKHQQEIKPIYDALLLGMPEDRSTHTPEQKVNYITAHLLDWYGREDKKMYWDKYRIQESGKEELLDEPTAIYGLRRVGRAKLEGTDIIETFRYPDQECDLQENDTLKIHGTELDAKIYAIDRAEQKVKISRPVDQPDVPFECVFKYKNFRKKERVRRLVQLGANILESGIENPNLQCAIDLMLRQEPRISSPVERDKETDEGRLEWLLKLDRGVLPIQGPPGAGKTYNGSRLIVELIKAGKRVGITALSHKVITGLLWAIKKYGDECDLELNMLQKNDKDDKTVYPWITTQDYARIERNIKNLNVIAGTSNMWANKRLTDSVDYLFVDEAGQLSLADTLACCYATKNLVLLGDPQQLRQPIQGVHPDGIDVSALEHIFQDQKTIGEDQGIFLGTTWRMHPKICSFNSDLYYDSKLLPEPSLERQKIKGNTPFKGAGLFYHPVEHSGNSNYCSQEVEAVVHIFNNLTKGDVEWINAAGEKFIVEPKHIRIITPYNRQRQEITNQLGGFDEVGTVDKFQGQEAPIIIYSMVTSSAADAPRGMDFLYNPNRFNVAVSRARAVVILVGSPLLFEPECKTPDQMRLANGLCYFMEKIEN
jgi:predicted RecB family nuclease